MVALIGKVFELWPFAWRSRDLAFGSYGSYADQASRVASRRRPFTVLIVVTFVCSLRRLASLPESARVAARVASTGQANGLASAPRRDRLARRSDSPSRGRRPR
jgi:hypothetical protein